MMYMKDLVEVVNPSWRREDEGLPNSYGKRSGNAAIRVVD